MELIRSCPLEANLTVERNDHDGVMKVPCFKGALEELDCSSLVDMFRNTIYYLLLPLLSPFSLMERHVK